MNCENSKLPLGICRHCIAALDAAKTDMLEIMEDEEVSEDDKYSFSQLVEALGTMEAAIVNLTNRELGEEEFMAEIIDPRIETEFGEETDILDEEIE